MALVVDPKDVDKMLAYGRQVAQSIDTDIDVVVFAGEENFSDATTDSTAGSIMRPVSYTHLPWICAGRTPSIM